MLTVVIPSYNHARYIEECLLAATNIRKIKRILVIDDGSTDNSVEIIKSFITKNKHIDIQLVQKENSGLITSLNLGLSLVDTEYVYFVASDDVPISAGVSELYEVMEKHAALAFCIGGGVNFYNDENVTPVYGENHIRFFNLDQGTFLREIFINYPNPILLQSSIFRSESLRKIGGWDTSLVLDDLPTFIKLFSMYDISKFLFLPNILMVKYRHHGTNSYLKLLRQYQMISDVLEKLAPTELKFRSIGYEWAYFFLQSLHQKKFALSLSLIKNVSPLTFIWAIHGIPTLIVRKFKRKCR